MIHSRPRTKPDTPRREGIDSDYRSEFERKLVSAEEAIGIVRPGDRVSVANRPQPKLLMDALSARKEDLRDVKVDLPTPSYDPGWLQSGWQESFQVTVETHIGSRYRPALDERRIDYSPVLLSQRFKVYDEPWRGQGRPVDVFLLVLSPPDRNGFCSFGDSLWNKRRMVQYSRKVIAEVDENQIRTWGPNHIHVSEIDYFVPNTSRLMSAEEGERLIDRVHDPLARAELRQISLYMSEQKRQEILPELCKAELWQIREYARKWGWYEGPEEAKSVAGYVSELIRDGDTIQLGIGTPAGFLPRRGAFDGKKDLGWHSELGARGVIDLIRFGVINGSRKTVNRGKAIFTSLDGSSPEEVEYAVENPLIELRDADYVANIQTVAAHDNFVSINNALSVDFSGQINSETILGSRLWGGTGGQTELHMGAVLSRGGRAIILLRSTALGGSVSRILPQQEEGAVITIPRTFADIVVTEYGVARLLGKSIRERAEELIAIAHPDFRADLHKAAQKLFYP